MTKTTRNYAAQTKEIGAVDLIDIANQRIQAAPEGSPEANRLRLIREDILKDVRTGVITMFLIAICLPTAAIAHDGGHTLLIKPAEAELMEASKRGRKRRRQGNRQGMPCLSSGGNGATGSHDCR